MPGPLRWPKAASGLAVAPLLSRSQILVSNMPGPGLAGPAAHTAAGAARVTAFRWGRRVRRHARLREPPAKGRNVSLLSFFCEFRRAWGSILVGPSSDFRTAVRYASSAGLQSVVRVGCCLRVLAGALGPGTGRCLIEELGFTGPIMHTEAM